MSLPSASKLAIENALHEFDIAFTCHSSKLLLFRMMRRWKNALTKAGIYPMPLGQAAVQAVDVRDIAEATAIALTSDEHQGKTYNLIGRTVLNGPRVPRDLEFAARQRGSVTSTRVCDTFGSSAHACPVVVGIQRRHDVPGVPRTGFRGRKRRFENPNRVVGAWASESYEEFARETALKWQDSKALHLSPAA